ncbi:MAG: hypothetical protein H0V46_01125, partial [Sphingomonas sp.]|nr:hypothetical protein [Sphingomonas sp.]
PAPPAAPVVVATPAPPAAPAAQAGPAKVEAAPLEPAPAAPTPFPVGRAEPALPEQHRTSLLPRSPWIFLLLLAAAAAIAAGAGLSRARRLGRTRAALSIDPRLDLGEGSCVVGGGSLACPPMSIRARLEFANG